jgi:ribosomal protein S18 acetylase RimI-like enzyme
VKTCYYEGSTQAISIADLLPPGELTRYWTISRINVREPFRGLGHGSRLLDRILRDADSSGTTLALEVHASGTLDDDDLVAWYRRRGFRFDRTGYMVRRPKPHNRANTVLTQND